MDPQDRKMTLYKQGLALNKPDGIERTAKRVQSYIARLELELMEARDKIQQLKQGGLTNSNVRITGTMPEDDQFLPNDVQVDFFTGEGRRRVDGCVSVRHDRSDPSRTRLRVESTDTIWVQGSAANSFFIIVKGR